MTAPTKLAVFNSRSYDKKFLGEAFSAHTNASGEASAAVEVVFHDFPLSKETVSLVTDAQAVCAFVNDDLSGPVLDGLHRAGVRAVLLRCAGYNNVNMDRARELGLFVANVPSYSPEAVAEFAVALMQTLNRNTHRAYNRVREGNFSLEGLLGRTLHGKTVGVVGTGRIGVAAVRILRGFGCRVLAHDPYPAHEAMHALGASYAASLDALLAESDIVTLHCPLVAGTRYMINDETLARMRDGAVLVNTSRGGLVDTRAVIRALKAGRLGGLALDVYEGERDIFYRDHSASFIDDDVLSRLTTFHNVIVCGHQAFFTEEALAEIAEVTVRNLDDFLAGRACANSLAGGGTAGSGALPVRAI